MIDDARPSVIHGRRKVKPPSRAFLDNGSAGRRSEEEEEMEMGSVAVLCDIHGNLPALDAVLAELRADEPDAVVVGGDAASGPMPVEVLARLRALPWPVHWLRGNADRALVMSFDGTVPPAWLTHPVWVGEAWSARHLPRAERDVLAGLPPLARLDVEELGEVLFCHATPRSDEERVTALTPEPRLAEILEDGGAPLVVAGHTHRQFDRVAGGRRLVNAGSVGRPYEHRPGAYWLRLGPAVQLRRTAYDTDAASAAFRALGYPGDPLAPVDPDVVAAHYEALGAEPFGAASRTVAEARV
jgi:predicted phosphodiesterase